MRARTKWPPTTTSPNEARERTLAAVLGRAQGFGFLGPAPIADHVAHAEGFLLALDLGANPGHLLDLGSGGGIPGLVLALRVPMLPVTLLEGGDRRASFLSEAVDTLALTDRVRIVGERAELAGRRPELRHAFDSVVARGFASPAVTAECAAPFLNDGGCLVVSEPPAVHGSPSRWPRAGCLLLGLKPELLLAEPFAFARLRQLERCGDRYPRRVGVPAKRPLF